MMLADRYRLEARLGHGSMGEVWRSWDTRLSRPVAVKLLADSAVGDDVVTARFRREARTAALINHPQVVTVYDFGTWLERCFLVMELVDGWSLADELRRDGPLPAQRVAAVAEEVAAGLAAAHEQGIVHRDIKPSNLLVDEEDGVKIADFGIARPATGDTTAGAARTGGITGTSLYLAPEAARGEAAGPPGDVYSLGCTLYELLTGRPPFMAEHPLAVLCQHVEAEPADPCLLRPELPTALGMYVLRMLAKNPLARPTARQTAAWFSARHWRGTAAGDRTAETVPPSPAPAPSRAVPPRSNHRLKKALVPLAAAAAELPATALVVAPPLAGGDHQPESHTTAPHSAGTAGPGPRPSAQPPTASWAVPAADDVRDPSPGRHHAASTHRPDPSTGPAASSAAPTSGRPTPTSPRPTRTSPRPTPTSPQPSPTSPQPTHSSSQPTPSGSGSSEESQGAAEQGR
jgi:eukaryotic-like serine/threonine-protein kinase